MSLLFLQNSLFSIHPSLRTPRVTRLAGYLRSEIDRLIRVLPSDSRFRAGANLIKVALKFVPVFLPVDTKFFKHSRDNRGTLSSIDFRIVNGIFSNDLIVMTRGVNRGSDRTHIHQLSFGKSIAHSIDPLAVMDDLFRDDKWLTHFVENAADFVAQFLVMHKLFADFLIVSKTSAAMDHGEISRFICGGEV